MKLHAFIICAFIFYDRDSLILTILQICSNIISAKIFRILKLNNVAARRASIRKWLLSLSTWKQINIRLIIINWLDLLINCVVTLPNRLFYFQLTFNLGLVGHDLQILFFISSKLDLKYITDLLNIFVFNIFKKRGVLTTTLISFHIY